MAGAAARTRATLVNAAFTGMVLDLLATGDRKRLDRALDELLDAFSSPARL